MKIGIHITTYNRKVFTEQCLKSLLWSEPKHSISCIVDNNSTDGSKEIIEKYQQENPIFVKTIFNNENKHLGMAIFQGWDFLKDKCDILTCINNDFLFEPGWEDNIIACFKELELDYAVGTVRPDREPQKHITPSGKGKYTTKNDTGAAYFLLTKHFKNGIYPSVKPFEKGYIGPGPSFHKMLQKNKLKGIRLAHPGILVRSSEYSNEDFIKYYDETFGGRGIDKKLRIYRENEKNGIFRGCTNWKDFVKQYYPNKKKVM
jgi:glycosyltransferase involved in cell wall biosynthesis